LFTTHGPMQHKCVHCHNSASCEVVEFIEKITHTISDTYSVQKVDKRKQKAEAPSLRQHLAIEQSPESQQTNQQSQQQELMSFNYVEHHVNAFDSGSDPPNFDAPTSNDSRMHHDSRTLWYWDMLDIATSQATTPWSPQPHSNDHQRQCNKALWR
jgi:hypothetical protein